MEINTLSLELTTHCQQNCLHCFARPDGKGYTHLPLIRALEVMDEGRKMGFSRLHLTGGEILLYPELFSVLDNAKKRGFTSIFINTNGHLIDKTTAEKLSLHKEIEISLSLNGEEKQHDVIRGKGAYQTAFKGLERALNFGIPVHVFALVNRHNIEGLPHFTAGLFKRHPGIRDLTFIQLRSGTEGEQDKLTPKNYLSLVRTTALLGMAGYTVQIMENPLSTAVALKMGFSHLPPSLPISREGRILIFADCTIGDNHSSDLRFGTYKSGKLTEVYNSPRFIGIRTENQAQCIICPHIETCRKGGLMKPSDDAHNIEPSDTPFCRKVLDLL